MCTQFCVFYVCLQDVNELIQAALLRYSADRIAKFDFALENSGGSVIVNKCSKTYPPALATYSVMGIPLWSIPSSPKAIIQVNLFTSIHTHCTYVYMYMYMNVTVCSIHTPVQYVLT